MKMRHNFIITIFFAVFMLGIFPKLAAIEENGEYDIDIAKNISQDICYYNIKGALKI